MSSSKVLRCHATSSEGSEQPLNAFFRIMELLQAIQEQGHQGMLFLIVKSMKINRTLIYITSK